MRIPITISLTFVFLLVLGLYYQSPTAIHSDEIMQNVSRAEAQTFNITTNTFPYYSMYDKNNVTVHHMISNLINSIVYPVIVQINTLMPLSIYIMEGGWSRQIMQIIYLILIIIGIIILFKLIEYSIVIYFFIKEKKKSKLKWYE